MKRKIFTGAATALITPFNEDYTVNYAELEKLVDDQINANIDALVICGTTGEASTLDHKDHIKVLEVAIKAASGRVPVIAGTGSNDTLYAVTLSQAAEKLGADGLLLVTPYYNKTCQNGLVAHYTYIADRVDTPIILYNVPSRTGVDIKPETYAKLAEHKNIVAAKEANGNISSVVATRRYCGDALEIYSGNDDQTVPILSLGGLGVISVISNVAPQLIHDMCNLFFNGKLKEAADMQVNTTNFVNALFAEVNPIPVKAAMNLIGYKAGPVRLPLIEASDATKAQLIKAMKGLNLL
ncbi:MAG: 4-hydroxy-tetrahydrodipicolinate synthase [Clostridia bacterium]|nr:4-hydroxy-tetrahydrodipicolinate synthase [Clostridia bacterium]